MLRATIALALSALLCTASSSDSLDVRAAARHGIGLDDVATLRTYKGLTTEDLLELPTDFVRRTLARLREPRPDHPAEAMAWRLRTLRDENGLIPHGADLRAKAQMQALMREGTAGGLDSTKWQEIGPGNIGGRTRAVAIDPDVPATLWVGSVSGGLWRSTDAGASWSMVDDLMANLAITAIVFTPGNRQVMYASTGEAFGNGDSIRGAGIFKSTDRGATWSQLPSTNTSDFYWVAKIAVSPDSTTLCAATRTGMWRSLDGGASFQKVHGSSSARCLDVDFHATDSKLAVAQLNDGGRSTSIYTRDGGASWRESTGMTSSSSGERTELTWHKGWTGAGNGCVYALKAASSTILYRSVDGGATFTQVSQSSILASQGWYDNTLWVDPSDRDANTADDVLIAGGIDLWRSTNGGGSFTRISRWSSWPRSAHADQHTIVEHPGFDGTGNRTVYFGNDGGIWRVDDVYSVSTTNGWINLNHSLGITQFYGGSRNRSTGTVIGGTQDNGTLRFTDALGYGGWTTMFGGDGGFCASDAVNSSYHYGEYVYLQIHRSTNGGSSSSYIYQGILDAGSAANFIAPFVLDPNDQARMLAGGRSLWRSANVRASTPSWTAIKPSMGSDISAIAVTEGNPDVVWVGHDDGTVYRTANGTTAAPAWTRRDTTSPALPDRVVTRITIDREDASHVFLTFGGYNSDNLWETRDGGATWRAATGLPSAPLRDVEQSLHEPRWLYAASEVGLLVSEDGGSSWTSPATPARVSIDELFWSQGHLYLVTYGRGMFRQSPYPAPLATDQGVPCQFAGAAAGPSLSSTAPELGTTVRFTIAGAATPGTGSVLMSVLAPNPTPISPGCFVQLNLAAPPVTLGTVAINAFGFGTVDLPLPDNARLAGKRVMTQAVVVAGQALYFSNGRELLLGY